MAARWAELDSCLAELMAAATTMRQLRQTHHDSNELDASSETKTSLLSPDDPLEAHCARNAVVAKLAKLQTLVADPSDLLSQLAMQNQILGCLHWLGEFQILAFIPRLGSIALQDVAELASVPEPQLRRIVRMMAAVAFLREPRVGQVEHTALSAPFGDRPSYHDALRFLTNTAAPAAMQMVPLTQRMRQQQLLHGAAFNDLPLATGLEHQAAPRRQWPSYVRYALGDQDSSIESILKSFDWTSLGAATVVDVGARSTTMACTLAECHPSLNLVVQMNVPPEVASPDAVRNVRVAVQTRTWAMPQTVRHAAVYALRVPYDFPTVFAQSRPARLRAELEAHLGVLRENSAARLIVTARLLPRSSDITDDLDSDDGVVKIDGEAVKAHVFDMSLLQLANDRELEVADLKELVSSVGDGSGHLVLGEQLCAAAKTPTPASVATAAAGMRTESPYTARDRAFEVRYQRGRLPI
ncbi:hypothetical protein M409DRAFT_30911 [Zasmidium cellare ATCC 36951]|uniref:O-methyltransferase domain-containing protein n=1 Tax=Zasmidium cellare ATCC 36951 TaxID=1080233 RepID=A0A6A6BUW7_ZASCE|nr:uncharacterized protein M409DRAFT_30911 [Zasmidium cellare ATCC 36951]KAF2158584.1 hypothetical protein M409DRAFT_30911 [Zasmidium cellare ATCC 36951]